MRKTLLLSAIATMLATACGSQQTPREQAPTDAISLHENLPGDSTLYGLACDGCTDSLLIFLPFSGGDPDTFNIIEAWQERRIYGRPHIGDELAVLLNPEQRGEALMVINLNMLRGQWCYMVTPTLRRPANGQAAPALPDSIRRRLLAPHEYGFRLKSDNSAYSLGIRRQTTADAMSIVQYPDVKHYTEWHILNGKLILKADTIPGMAQKTLPESDTASIVLLRRDSLVLRFSDHEQAYYRKNS